MKKIKFAVCFFLLFFCLTLNGELYQNYLDEFTGGLFSFHAARMFGEEEEQIVKKREIVTRLSDKYNCEFFCVDKNLSNAESAKIVIYTPDTSTANSVKQKLQIDQKEYKSLFSGVTNVEFKALNQANENMTFYFFGEDEDILKIKKNIGFNAGRLKKEKEKNVVWISVSAWLIFGVLLILLTRFDVLFQKKESIVLISLGKTSTALILKNIFIDVVALVLMLVALTIVLNRFTYLFYNKFVLLTIFLIVLLFNSLVYTLMFRYNVKAALSKANLGKRVLWGCYSLKAVSLVITVVVLSANILIIRESGSLFNKKDLVSAFKEYSFVQVYSKNHYDTNENTEELISEIKTDIFLSEYQKNDTAFSVVGITELGTDYLLINKNASSILENADILKDIDFTKDYYVFIDEDCENPDEKTKILEETLLNNTERLEGDVITYRENVNILKFENSSRRDSVINFGLSKNPVVVLYNFKNGKFLNDLYPGMFFENIMFRFSEQDKVYYEKKYQLEENMIEIKMNSVTDRSEYAWLVLGRTVGLSTALSVFMIFLELLMITTVEKFEYITNAAEISIKKILGYSLLRRNKSVFIINTISVLAGILISVVAGALMKSSMTFVFITLGITILILEYLAILYNVIKLEKASVVKILKGGCL